MSRLLAILCGVLTLSIVAGSGWAQTLETHSADARAAMGEVRDRLMAELTAAMADGPAAAIRVCRDAAPEIHAAVGEETGWTIRRTSLKVRNPANAPDADERAVLLSFASRAAAGQDLASLRSVRLLSRGGGEIVHVMQAIPAQEPCLACHGRDIDPEVRAAIDALYPEDRATGFAAGDIRGAFSLTRPHEEVRSTLSPWERIAALALSEEEVLPGLGLTGNPRLGRALFAQQCKGCHRAEDVAAIYFGDGKGAVDLCDKLETHGSTTPGQDCDIAAFLMAVERAALD